MVEQWPGDSPVAWIDDVGHAIAERYRSIEDALLSNLQRHADLFLEAPDDLVARYRAIQSLREQAERLVLQVDPDELARWATAEAAMGASAEIARVLLDFPAYGAMGVGKVTSLTAGGTYAVAAVELDLRDSLRALNARILRAPADAYQAMTSKHVSSLLTGLTTSQALHRRILDEYIADGITGFVDRSGRRWTIGAYSEMATRTAAARAWRDQSVASMKSAGIRTFTPVIGSSACDPCAAWASKVVTDGGPTGEITVAHAITAAPTTITVDGTLDEMRASGWGHPNCRCVLVPGLPGGPDASKFSTHSPEQQRDRERLRELEREVRSAKRDGDPEAIGEAQADLRKHVDETGIIRRPYREQLPFADGGDTNPQGAYSKPRTKLLRVPTTPPPFQRHAKAPLAGELSEFIGKGQFSAAEQRAAEQLETLIETRISPILDRGRLPKRFPPGTKTPDGYVVAWDDTIDFYNPTTLSTEAIARNALSKRDQSPNLAITLESLSLSESEVRSMLTRILGTGEAAGLLNLLIHTNGVWYRWQR